jgi:hypothetical protein
MAHVSISKKKVSGKCFTEITINSLLFILYQLMPIDDLIGRKLELYFYSKEGREG